MKNNKNRRPNEYTAYNEITVCSNKIIGGGNIISIGDIIPFYIGVGHTPKVWLKAIVDVTKKTFIDIVESSVSMHPAIKIVSTGRDIEIKIGETIVLRTANNTNRSIEIVELDLRPLGLNIYGNNKGLKAGGMNLSGNTLQGTGTLLVLS